MNNQIWVLARVPRLFLLLSFFINSVPLHAAADVPAPGDLTATETKSFKAAGIAAVIAFLGTVAMNKADYHIARRMLQRAKELTRQGVPYPEIKTTIVTEFADTTWWQKAGWYAVAAVWGVCVLCAGWASWSMMRRGDARHVAAKKQKFEAQVNTVTTVKPPRYFETWIHPEVRTHLAGEQTDDLDRNGRLSLLDARINCFERLVDGGVPRAEAAVVLSGGERVTKRSTQRCVSRISAQAGSAQRDERNDRVTNLLREARSAYEDAERQQEQWDSALKFIYGPNVFEAPSAAS
ncbi:MAG: hypothetical protein PVJ92_02825 [Candidatus Dependentiae bacterium]|jgi:hypothetical protein